MRFDSEPVAKASMDESEGTKEIPLADTSVELGQAGFPPTLTSYGRTSATRDDSVVSGMTKKSG